MEVRDTDKKEVYFSCFDLFTGKKIFKNYQPDEKYWIGVELFRDNIIFFHRYAKPDMPKHKEVWLFDINEKRIKAKIEDSEFLFYWEGRVYTSIETFSGRKYFSSSLEDPGNRDETETEEIRKLSALVNSPDEYKDYLFPEPYGSGTHEIELINKYTEKLELSGNPEFIISDPLLLFNYHAFNKRKELDNIFYVLNLKTGGEIFSEILNSNVNAFAPDSFFIYKNLLLLIKDKKELKVFNLE